MVYWNYLSVSKPPADTSSHNGHAFGQNQYFTFLHEFRQILAQSHRMSEFCWESAGMVWMYNSSGLPWIPSWIWMEFLWTPGGITIFYNDYKTISNGIPADFHWNSDGIPWIPSGIIPGGSGIPTTSISIPWKKVGISMEMEAQMAEAPIPCSTEFWLSSGNPVESTGTHGGE